MATELFALAQTQHDVAALIARLTREEKRIVLTALLTPLLTPEEVAAFAGSGPGSGGAPVVTPPVRRGLAKTTSARAAQKRVRAKRGGGNGVGRPSKGGRVGKPVAAVENFSAKIRAALREKPGRPLGEVSKYTYGVDDDNHRGKVRSLLSVMKKRGHVTKNDAGGWEATDP